MSNDTKTGLGGKPGRPRDPQRTQDVERLKAAAAGRKVRLNANVPADLYGRYKEAVERRGLTVTADIVLHMEAYLEEHG